MSFRFPGVHWTVSELTDYVRDLFENDHQMHDVAVIAVSYTHLTLPTNREV